MSLEHDLSEERVGAACVLSCIYFLCMPFTVVSIGQGFSLLKAVSLVIMPALVANLFVGKHRLHLQGAHLFIVLYLFYTLLGLLWVTQEDVRQTIWGMAQAYGAVLLISVFVYNSREKVLIERVWLCIGAVCIVMGITGQAVAGDEERTTMMLWGGEEDPNQFCGYFLLPMMLGIKWLITPRKRHKPLALLYVVSIVYVLFKTGSRGGFVAVMVPAILYLLAAPKGWRAKLAAVGIALAGTVLFAGILFPMLPEGVAGRYTLARVAADRGSSRIDIWKTVLTGFSEEPQNWWWGGGIYHTGVILKRAGFINTMAHNQWIQVLVDQGIMGVCLYFPIVPLTFHHSYAHRPAVALALLGAFILSLSLTMYRFIPFLDSVALAAMTYQSELAEETDREEKNYDRK